MKKWIPLTICFAVLALGVSIASGQGASPRAGTVVIPGSSAQRPADIGVRSHTNYLIFVPARKPDFDALQGETPGSIACIYGLVANTAGCPIVTAATVHSASGDNGGVPNWPSTSPNVPSAGGTTIQRAEDGTFTGETAWSDSGGGASAFEARPAYQDVISNIVGDFRGVLARVFPF